MQWPHPRGCVRLLPPHINVLLLGRAGLREASKAKEATVNKITTLFERDWEGDRSRVLDQVHEGCEWVLEGEGLSTRKYDGMCVMYDGSEWWARREVREG